MSLKNSAMLYGLLLAVIPILLHLFMRAKPKKLIFPALSLIQVTRKNNVRRMRLRHWWLLLLRILAIALLVLALTRPTLPAANYGLNLSEGLTFFAVLLVGIAIYFFTVRRWKSQRMPSHRFNYRRALLRAGTGAGMLLLLLLLVGWPYQQRVFAEIKEPIAGDLPVAAVMIFDTSLSMGYHHENQTRLEAAKKVGMEHVGQLPRQSRVAITSTDSEDDAPFMTELVSAQKWINDLELSAKTVQMNERIQSALRWHQEDYETLTSSGADGTETTDDQFLREIYLFTDLSQTAWQLETALSLREKIEQTKNVHLYLIDVGVLTPTNVSVAPLKLSIRAITDNDEVQRMLHIETTVEYQGINDLKRTAELKIDQGERSFSKEKIPISLQPGTPVPLSFTLPKLEPGITQGKIEIESSDPLLSDNTQYFTLHIPTPPKVLLVSEGDSFLNSDAFYWGYALKSLTETGSGAYGFEYVQAKDFATTDLKPFVMVCMINVKSPTDDDWNHAKQFVETGGGFAVFLGTREIDPTAYHRETALEILPATRLRAHLKLTPPETLDIGEFEHELFQKIRDAQGSEYLTKQQMLRFWKVDPHKDAAVIARFTGPEGYPALLEKSQGWGRVLLMTTGVDLAPEADRFSDLALEWPFLVFVDQVTEYLSQLGKNLFNYTAGNDVLLKVSQQQPVTNFNLRYPGFRQTRGTIREGEEFYPIPEVAELGNYQVLDRDNTPPYNLGFSINPPAGESDFTKLTAAQLDELLGEENYHLAKELSELERVVTSDRIGKEVFPLVITLMLIIFCAEHLVANYFYREPEGTTPKTAPETLAL